MFTNRHDCLRSPNVDEAPECLLECLRSTVYESECLRWVFTETVHEAPQSFTVLIVYERERVRSAAIYYANCFLTKRLIVDVIVCEVLFMELNHNEGFRLHNFSPKHPSKHPFMFHDQRCGCLRALCTNIVNKHGCGCERTLLTTTAYEHWFTCLRISFMNTASQTGVPGCKL